MANGLDLVYLFFIFLDVIFMVHFTRVIFY